MENIRLSEKEINRIEKLTHPGLYNPIDILGLNLEFNNSSIKEQYKNLVLLLHPDKTFNEERFVNAFNLVVWSNKMLADPEIQLLCIKSKTTKNRNLLKSL